MTKIANYPKILITVMAITVIVMGAYRLIPWEQSRETVAVMGRPGDQSGEIADIQAALIHRGYTISEINGLLNLETAGAIRQFQEDNGLDVSGCANAETLYRLGLAVSLKDLCLYEDRRFLAATLDAVCPDASYLTKVALADLILKRQKEEGYPDSLPGVVFGEFQFRDALLYDYGSEPSADAWQAVRDASNGMSPCPEARYYYQKGNEDAFLSRLKIVFKNGSYCFAAPPAA